MKYQIIKIQVNVNEFEYTSVLEMDGVDPFNNKTRKLIKDLKGDRVLPVVNAYDFADKDNYEISWKTVEEAEEVINKYKAWIKSPENPQNWANPVVVKEIPAE